MPGRKWVPSLNLSYVKGEEAVTVWKKEDGRSEMVKRFVKGIVGSLPIVWRLADWLYA